MDIDDGRLKKQGTVRWYANFRFSIVTLYVVIQIALTGTSTKRTKGPVFDTNPYHIKSWVIPHHSTPVSTRHCTATHGTPTKLICASIGADSFGCSTVPVGSIVNVTHSQLTTATTMPHSSPTFLMRKANLRL